MNPDESWDFLLDEKTIVLLSDKLACTYWQQILKRVVAESRLSRLVRQAHHKHVGKGTTSVREKVVPELVEGPPQMQIRM